MFVKCISIIMRILSSTCSTKLLRYNYRTLAFLAIVQQLRATIRTVFLLHIICSTYTSNHTQHQPSSICSPFLSYSMVRSDSLIVYKYKKDIAKSFDKIFRIKKLILNSMILKLLLLQKFQNWLLPRQRNLKKRPQIASGIITSRVFLNSLRSSL